MTVWWFDYCNSSLGVWSREYHATEEEAKKSRQFWIDHFGWCEDDEDEDGNPVDLDGDLGEGCGEYADITAISPREVDISPEGIIALLNDTDPNC